MDIDPIIAAAGGVTKLAQVAGVDRTTVTYWRTRGQIPVQRALRIHHELAIPLHELRPDVWADPRSAGLDEPNPC